jgi:hypothetical protein
MAVEQTEKNGYIPPSQPFVDKVLSRVYIRPETLPHLVFPLVEYVHENKPDYIIGLDSGGRIPTLALYMLHQRLYGQLPTIDHSVHFKKLSRKLPHWIMYDQLSPVVRELLQHKQYPHVFVVDDWINTGKTKDLVTNTFDHLSGGKISVSYGVMRGWRADITGDLFSVGLTAWRDNPNMSGVLYEKGKVTPQVMHTSQAHHLREEIAKHMDIFAAAAKQARE